MISRSSFNIFVAIVAIFCCASIARADFFSGSLPATGPTFDRPFVPFNQGDPCILSPTGTAVHYSTYKFTLTSATNVTISFLPADGAVVSPADADPMLILYGPGGFNPASGCANAIMANDDADASTLLPKLITTTPLAAGTYTIVVTTFDNVPAEPQAGPLPYTFTAFSSVPIGRVQHVVDFNGDGMTDFSVIRDLDATPDGRLRWFVALNGPNTIFARDFGLATDTQTPVDFDGDNKTDIAVWRPGPSAFFYILQSSTNTVRSVQFGQEGDDPTVVGDYDGDGKADLAVYRDGISTGDKSMWFFLGSLNNPNNNISYVGWGQSGDFPAPGDYDGDGKNDFCIQRAVGGQGVFWLRTAAGAISAKQFGAPTDTIVPGDYDGDGRTDIATIRGVGSGMRWQWLASSNGTVNYSTFGLFASDIPVQGDYDGDRVTDIAVWRPGSPSVFWVRRSKTNTVVAYGFGNPDDIATAGFNTH